MVTKIFQLPKGGRGVHVTSFLKKKNHPPMFSLMTKKNLIIIQ
jgi:hypothetical protein